MGATATKDAKGMDEYVWWNVQQISVAHEKVVKCAMAHAEAAGLPFDPAHLTLSRFEFLDIFTDITSVRDNAFLALPLSIFTIFQDSPDATHINGLELLLVMCMFCQAPSADDRLALVFKVFDTDQSGALEMDEMRTFLINLALAMHKIGVLPKVPTSKVFDTITAEMFTVADVNGDGSISQSEFVMWCRKHVHSQQLLAAVQRTKAHAEKQQGGAAKVNSKTDSLTRALAVTAKLNSRRQALRQISKKSRFEIQELRALRKKFAAKAGGQDGVLSRQQFVDVMRAAYPQLSVSDVNDMFSVFDADGSGELDFKEFCMGMSKAMKGTVNDKILLMFEVFDRNGDGEMSVEELLSFVKAGQEELSCIYQFSEEIVRRMDKDNSGSVSGDEFTTALTAEVVLFECFSRSPLPGMEDARASIRWLRSQAQAFDLATLAQVYKSCVARWPPKISLEMTEQVFLNPPVGCPAAECKQTVRDVFQMLDKERRGTIPLVGLFHGFAEVSTEPRAAIARFIFGLYDADGTGQLDLGEIIHLVFASQEASSKSSSEAVQVIQDLDSNGNGTISISEFQEAAEKNPGLLSCFARIFGLTGGGDEDIAEQRRKAHERMVRSLSKAMMRATAAGQVFESPQDAHHHQGVSRLRRASLHTATEVVDFLQTQQQTPVPVEKKTVVLKSVASAARSVLHRVSSTVGENRGHLRRMVNDASATVKAEQFEAALAQQAKERAAYLEQVAANAAKRHDEAMKLVAIKASLKKPGSTGGSETPTRRLTRRLIPKPAPISAAELHDQVLVARKSFRSPTGLMSPSNLGSPTAGLLSPNAFDATGTFWSDAVTVQLPDSPTNGGLLESPARSVSPGAQETPEGHHHHGNDYMNFVWDASTAVNGHPQPKERTHRPSTPGLPDWMRTPRSRPRSAASTTVLTGRLSTANASRRPSGASTKSRPATQGGPRRFNAGMQSASTPILRGTSANQHAARTVNRLATKSITPRDVPETAPNSVFPIGTQRDVDRMARMAYIVSLIPESGAPVPPLQSMPNLATAPLQLPAATTRGVLPSAQATSRTRRAEWAPPRVSRLHDATIA